LYLSFHIYHDHYTKQAPSNSAIQVHGASSH